MTVPRLSDQDMIRLAETTLDLLQEVRECTIPALRLHGLERHAEDLGKAEDEVLTALDPFIVMGDRELWAAIGIHVDDEDE